MSIDFEEMAGEVPSEPDKDERVVEPQPPDELIIADFHDERNRIDNYWPRVEKLDVPMPETVFFDLIRNEDGGMPGWDTRAILNWMRERDSQRAFIRSAYKSALTREGQFIYDDEESVVDRTVAELLSSHVMQKMPHGGKLVVREWLDLDFCYYARDDCHPEIRFFIEDGEVTAATPRLNSGDFLCENAYESARDVTERGIERVHSHAETIADEFTEDAWSVDFVMDTNGKWYFTEMGLNGVYWSTDKECWRNICGHGELEGEGISPAEAFADELPDEPDESLKSNLR